MRRFSSDHDDFSELEAELRAGRPEPRSELVRELAARVGPTSARVTRRRSRAALALAFAVVVLVALAAFGGIGYAKSSFVVAAKSSSHAVSGVVRGGQSTGQGADTGQGAGTGQGGVAGGSGGGEHGEHHYPPWEHQYSHFVLVCYPFKIHGHTLRRTIVVPRRALSLVVPPGTLGPCRIFPG